MADRRSIGHQDIIAWGERHSPILINAIRLLDDASVLRKARRYASATALAVLSLEETGKFLLLHDHFKDRIIRPTGGKSNSSFTHRQKQRAAASIVQGVMGFHEIFALSDLAGYRISFKSADDSGFSLPAIEDAISGLNEEVLDRFINNSDFGEHLKFFVQLMKGRFDNLKQRCFYVDEHRSGDIVAGHEDIGRSTCDGAMRTANKAVWATKVELRRYAKFVLAKSPHER